MTATRRQITYRLQAEGKAEILRDQKEVAQGWRGTYDAADAGATQAAASAERLERRWRSLAQAARDSEQASRAQSRFNAALGVDAGTAGSARDSAAFFDQLAAAEERAATRARELKAALDPLGAAQDRLNDELREYQMLADGGHLSSTKLAQAQALARARFDETAAAIGRQERGLTRLALASRLNLARQGADVMVTAAMGMNPAMIAMQQGPQIADAWATSNIKLNGSLLAVLGSVGLLAGAVGIGAAAWWSGEKSSLAYDKAVTGVGRTSRMTAEELKAAAEAGAEAAQVSIASAREWATAYAATGKIGGEVMSGLVSITKDYASFARMDASDAVKTLSKAMGDPAKAAVEMTREFGLLDQKTIDHIETLDKLGRRTEAQKVLMEALTGAVSGHGEKVGELTSLWDVATRTMSNYWTTLGEALHTTRDEQLAKYDAAIRNARRDNANPRRIAEMEQARTALAFEIGYDRADAENKARIAGQNQDAQGARDRLAAGASDRDKAKRDAERAAREAEREAREIQQRQRREEDREAAIAVQVARATQDWDAVGRLEEEERLRQRIRQLEDDGLKTAEARSKAMGEETRIRDALGEQQAREAKARTEAASLDADRIEGLDRFVADAERRVELERRIVEYAELYKDIGTATTQAKLDQKMIDDARLRAQREIVREAELERQLRLAQLSGNDGEYRRLDMEARIQRRAREIEQRGRDGKPLNRGEGVDQAMSEVQQELDAEATGARRTWLRGLLADINRGDLRDAVANQLLKAGDRLLDKLIDGFMSLDLSGGGKGGGIGGWISSAANFLFGGKGVGKNAQGTDYWDGRPTWVGENGPELLFPPRGSRIVEHNRSLQMAAAGRGGGVGPVAFTFAPQIDARGAGPREVDALSAKMDEMASRLKGEVPALVQDALQRRIID